MNYEESISLADLTKEIAREKQENLSGNDAFARTIRSKYAFLFDRVIMRSKLDYRFKGKDMIPLRDKTIVKALLIRSYFSGSTEDKDHIFVEWFNGNIKEDDYLTIAKLGYRVEMLFSEELYYDDWDMDKVTCDEWIAAIHASIKLNLALNVINATSALQELNTRLTLLDHGIPFGDLIKGNEYGSRVYAWKGLSPQIDMSKPLKDSLKRCFSLDSYSNLLLEFIYLIENDAYEKSIEFIKAYAELKKMSGYISADQLLSTDSLASEYTAFFQNIYEYLSDKPELIKEIEQEIGTADLLAFFRMKDRNKSAK